MTQLEKEAKELYPENLIHLRGPNYEPVDLNRNNRAAYIKGRQDEAKRRKWIPVSERNPEDNKFKEITAVVKVVRYVSLEVNLTFQY